MSRRFVPVLIAAGTGAGAVAWALLGPDTGGSLALFVAAGAAPTAVLLAVRARMSVPLPIRALVGGAMLGPVLALASHALVAAFAATFFLGFAESGRHLLEALRADPRLTTVLASPWVLLAIIEVTAVAPITEEVAKALGAGLARPPTRAEAFLAGVAAGAGFAFVENIVYAVAGAGAGGAWPAVVLGRALGAAVHPLATGIVAMGWWEWKRHRGLLALAKRALLGAGIHALWNGSVVALWVVETAFVETGATPELGAVALAYEAVVGLVMAALLWMATVSVSRGRDPFAELDLGQGRAVAAWALMGASVLVPVGMLIMAFPRFYLG